MTSRGGGRTAPSHDRWLVVDASVWVSRYLYADARHVASERWLFRQLSLGNRIVAPTLLLVEVAGAIARRTGDTSEANHAVSLVRRLPELRWLTLSLSLCDHAAALAAELHLRGADAVYVAIADRLAIPLVTWDSEQLTRTSSRISAYSPNLDAPP